MNEGSAKQFLIGSRESRARRTCIAMSLLLFGCGKSEEPPAGPKKTPSATASSTPRAAAAASPTATHIGVRKWDRPIVCQPQLKKVDGTTPQQGTGFFVQTPGGKVAAVSSAHFLDFDGPPVTEAAWLRFPALTPIVTLTTSWGKPGSKGTDQDNSSDYWLLPIGDEQAEVVRKEFEVLELDPRPLPQNGERVWFPNKDQRATLGFTVMGGRVLSANAGIITVELDGAPTLQSQSGSPIISRQTLKVIGTLCTGVVQNDKTFLWLAPVAKMRSVLNDETNFPALQTVIGKVPTP